MKKAIILSLAFVAVLSSCRKDTDDEAPVLSNIRINGLAGLDHELVAGNTFTLSLNASDNESLNQLKVDIHTADDGHSHQTVSPLVRANDWEVFQVINLSGSSQSVSRSYTIPNDQQGVFHLILQCLDAEGNESDTYLIELDIANTFLPQINLESTVPVQNEEGEIEAGIGTLIQLIGSIVDESGLAEVHVELIDESTNPETVVWEEEFDPAGAKSFDLSSISFNIPQTDATHLSLHIHAADSEGYESDLELEIHIE